MKLTKKMMVAGAGLVAAVGIGSAAFAYFSTTGTGSGDGSVSTTINGVKLYGTVSGSLTPTTPATVTVQYTSDNAVDVKLGPITISNVKAFKHGTTTELLNCGLGSVDATAGATYAPAATKTSIAAPGLAITMSDQNSNQNDCLSADFTFKLDAAAVA